MNQSFKFYIVFIFLIIVLTGCDDGNIDNSQFVNVKEETITEDITSIYLEWNSGILTFSKTEDNEIKLTERAKEGFLDKNMFSYEIENNTLKILDPNFNQPVIMLSHDLNIEIPEKLYGSLVINATSVEILLEDFNIRKLEFDTNATEQHISGNYEELLLKLTSANIDYNLYECPKKLEINGYVLNGDIKLPENSDFSLTENLESSNVTVNFDYIEDDQDSLKVGTGENFFNIILNQSSIIIDKN